MSDTLYIRGFNEGYVLTEHLPGLARGISKVESPSPYFEGFRDGREEYVLERAKEMRPSWLKTGPERGNEPGRAPEQDRDRSQDRDRDQDREYDAER